MIGNTKDILTLAVEIGDVMLRNGAEIYRIEDTVIHILSAYEVEDFDVYVLSNGIFASANEGREDSCSIVRHVPLGDVNLERISALNQLARDVVAKKCDVKEAWERLEECKNIKKTKKWFLTLCCGLGCGSFAYLYGGHVIDGVFAFFIGILLEMFMLSLESVKMPRFAKCLFSSMFAIGLSLIPILLGIPVSQDKIVIGAIMPLLPGIAFTTSIRDFYNGDYLSGVIHLVDALLTSFCIAVGVGVVIYLYQRMGGVL